MNRYDIDFLGRTSDDVELCQVRRGMTKYIMDRSDYDAVESQVFLDCAIGGLGWFGVRYKFDNEIQDGETRPDIDPLYYSSELQKVRVVECWYREHGQRTIFFTLDGQQLPQEQVTPEMIQMGMIADSQDIPTNEVKLCVFFDRTLLEEITSPYQHGDFPYVPMVYHHYGVGDTPAGFVRAMKDPQRELNKRRIRR